MASGRPKRHISVPKKFIDEGYTLPDSPERNHQQRVLRFLNKEDLTRSLQDLTVYVLWPDDSLWYEAVIQKWVPQNQTAMLFYTDTAEEEMVQLEELIGEKSIAFLEFRPEGSEIKDDEVLADGLIHVATSPSVSEASEPDEESLPDGGSPRQERSQVRAGNKLQRKESDIGGLQPMVSGNFTLGMSRSSSDQLSLSRSGSLTRHVSGNSRDLADLTSKRLELMNKLREKTIEQLRAVLQLGVKPQEEEPNTESENKDKSDDKEDPIAELAKSIENAILNHCGGANNEYKNKFRTLYFNLKDLRNPELRRRVLEGEISPERLVSMSPKELAYQELNQWREKKSADLLRQKVLGRETAAKFSTAAALEQLKADRKDQEVEQITEPPPSEVPLQPQLPQVETAEVVDAPAEERETEQQIEQPPQETTSNELPSTDVMDLDEIPEWAMEVVATPSQPPATPAGLYSPKGTEERTQFGPVPILSAPPELTALFMRSEGNVVTGEFIWQGEIGLSEQVPFKAQCIAVAGKCDLKHILVNPQIVVQGRKNLKKVEEFLEKLRTSKSRTVTIAILRSPTESTEEDIAAIQENVHYYSSRERTGAMALADGIEGYLIAKCSLTKRLLSAARTVMQDTDRIPEDIDSNEFLLVTVHRKDWTPPTEKTDKSVDSVTTADPRIRAGLKPATQKETTQRPLPAGLTLDLISNLAAKLGVQKQSAAPAEASSALLPPHQMTVPTSPAMDNYLANVVQPERPKFLIFDPLTNKVLTLSASSVHYDPATNRVMVIGALPPGYAVQQLPAPTVDNQQTVDRGVLYNSIGSKTSHGESVGDVQQVNMSVGFSSVNNAVQPNGLASAVPNSTKPFVQPVLPGQYSPTGFSVSNFRKPDE